MPVRLHEDAVDVLDVDGFVGRANGLDHAADAEITGLTQHAVRGADDEVNGRSGDGVVAKSDAVELCRTEF